MDLLLLIIEERTRDEEMSARSASAAASGLSDICLQFFPSQVDVGFHFTSPQAPLVVSSFLRLRGAARWAVDEPPHYTQGLSFSGGPAMFHSYH